MKFLNILKESFVFAYRALVLNKLRTFLSLLGVTIGIFSIISVFTVIGTMERSIRESIASLGDNVVYVQKWPWEFGPEYAWWKYLRRPVVNIKELNAIKKKSEKSAAASFTVTSMKTVQYKNSSVDDVVLWASSHEFEDIRSFEIESGRYFSPYESHNGNNKVIIGAGLAEGLFDNEDPLGKYIKVLGHKLMVIGIFKKEGDDMFNSSMDNAMLIPVNYARGILDLRNEGLNPMIMVKAKDGVSTQELIDELRGIMRAVRRLRPVEEDDFALNRASLITKGFESVFSSINWGGIIIGGFAILVGAFGIANIMFVSVKERTKQIGIQKALGAKNHFILFQFLYESVMLSLIGGIIGLVLIYIGTIIANKLTEMNFGMSTGNIIWGLVISILAGIISGWLPARSASRLNPVDAINSSF